MKITLSKAQWQNIGKKTGWIKKAQDVESRFDYPYSLLELIRMQDNGLPLATLSFQELKEAKDLEKHGFINKVVKHDKSGTYSAYIINEEKFKFMGWKTKIAQLNNDNFYRKILSSRIKEVERLLATEKNESAITTLKDQLKELNDLMEKG